MELNELSDADLLPPREVQVVDSQVVEADMDAPFYGEAENLFEDLKRGAEIIRKTNLLLRFLSDPDLIKTITKRERTAMGTMIKQGAAYLGDVDPAIAEVS